MARKYGAVKTSVWEPRSDFRTLSTLAQWAYMMLLSQPQITNLGLLAYVPTKWARLAHGLTDEQLEEAIGELAAAYYILVDHDTGELLVRTFIKHDEVWKQPKLVTNARRLINEVESDEIRDYLAARHPWLLDNRSKADIAAHEETPIDTGSESTIDRGSSPPAPKALSKGVSKAGSPPRAPAGPGSGSGVSSKKDQELELDTAAAELEAPRHATIAAAANQYAVDLDVLEPEATALPAELFDDVVHRVGVRCTTGHVDNPAGLMIKLLRRARREHDKRAAIDNGATARTPLEDALFEARSYARGQHPWEVAGDLLARKLSRVGVENGSRGAILEAAHAAFLAESARSDTP